MTEASGEPLEGVTVSAKPRGRPITTSVFTDKLGAYVFRPLESGPYQVWAQAAGWKGVRRRVDLAGARQRQGFVLHETADFAAQLTGDQMVAALPEDTPARRRMKAVFVGVCTECHAANLVLHNRGGFGLHDATVDRGGNLWFTYNEPESATRTVGHRQRRDPLRPGGARVHRVHVTDAARPHVRGSRRPGR